MKNRKLKEKVNFWSNGISDRAFIMVISVTTFFLFATIGMVSSLFIDVSSTYMDILQMTVPPLMTIILSVFGIEGVEKITERKTKQEIGNIVEKKIDCYGDACEITNSVMDDIKEEVNDSPFKDDGIV